MPAQRTRRLNKVARQKLSMRKSVWPNLDDSKLWDRFKTDGWLTIPRALPLILRIMDMLSGKGTPVAQTYLDLWCRTYDDSFVIVNKPREMAFYSGFSGERAERTWGNRIKLLAQLGFIDFKPGPSGHMHYIVLYNPYQIIKQHFEKRKVQERFFFALRERVIEIGANEFEDIDDKPKQKTKNTKKK